MKKYFLISTLLFVFSMQNLFAQENQFNGSTIDRIKNTGKIRISYRTSSIPLSYVDNKKPIGYATDICTKISQTIQRSLGMNSLEIEFVEVDSTNRIPYLTSGKIDLECGSTTNNAERRKVVDFSIPYYIAGMKIMAKEKSNIGNLLDLNNKKVALSKGTTSLKTITQLNEELSLNLQIVEANDFESATRMVLSNQADAFILDDLLLYGLKAKLDSNSELKIVGDYLSIEPLAIMMRKNDKIKYYVDKTIHDMMINGEINYLYSKWFENPIPPKNENLKIKQSILLKNLIKMPTDTVGD